MENSVWWPIALSDEISASKPKAYSMGEESIVLFRDSDGVARALENRCPHRRVPFTLGTIRKEGWLQCGYHGWSFDGETGRCKAIPNLPDETQVPPTYRVYAYCVEERSGVVYVTAKSDEIETGMLPSERSGQRFTGRETIGFQRDEYIAILMDEPSLVLECKGFRITNTMISDPHEKNGYLVMERAAHWLGRTNFDAFVREYALIFKLAINLKNGETLVTLELADETLIAVSYLGITPSARGTTAILWQSFVVEGKGIGSAVLKVINRLGKPIIAPRKQLPASKITDVIVGPSHHWPRHTISGGIYGDQLNSKGAK